MIYVTKLIPCFFESLWYSILDYILLNLTIISILLEYLVIDLIYDIYVFELFSTLIFKFGFCIYIFVPLHSLLLFSKLVSTNLLAPLHVLLWSSNLDFAKLLLELVIPLLLAQVWFSALVSADFLSNLFFAIRISDLTYLPLLSLADL